MKDKLKLDSTLSGREASGTIFLVAMHLVSYFVIVADLVSDLI